MVLEGSTVLVIPTFSIHRENLKRTHTLSAQYLLSYTIAATCPASNTRSTYSAIVTIRGLKYRDSKKRVKVQES
jgi:hypothetical protein